MPPAANQAAPAKILVLRGRQAVENYLANHPKPPPESAQAAWLDKAAWLAESADADEATWAIARDHELAALAAIDFDPDASAAAEIAPDVARRLRAIPIEVRNNLIAVAMEDAGDRKALEELNFLCKHRVVPLAAPAKAIRDGIAHHYDRPEDYAIATDLGIDPHEARSELGANEVERLGREQPVVRLVDELLADAVRRRASDIHIRPGALGTEILYRIDGAMVPVRRLMQALHAAAVARIKVIADMNLAEHRRPQDGRTTFAMRDGRKVDLRVSVLPAVRGESVVIRLLDAGENLWNVDQLGLSPLDRERLGDVMARSHGMFLTTGPTGSGKSTTLYAMLLELRRMHLNILTIEDPVEFEVDGIEQMQVNRAVEFTFASAMRNFLRHDPDVVMVGEIRDRETAGIAVESALTGHLLLSTLHTNSAATTVTRLLDLGIESYLLRTSLLAVMAQRLVRLTCEHCKVPEAVEPHVRDVLGIAHDEAFFTGRGCPQCDGVGVHRRQAVYELMVVIPAMRKLIVDDAQADLMNQLAIAEGMTTITQGAIALARAGRISLAEAWRIRTD